MIAERTATMVEPAASYLAAAGADIPVLSVQGSLTFEKADALRLLLKRTKKEEAAVVVIDLSACAYIDSAGLATLVQALKRARRRQQRLVLAGIHPQVRRLLEMTRLDRVFETQPTVEAALAGNALDWEKTNTFSKEE